MRSKTLLKIELRNKGIETLPSCYQKNGTVICSFTLPKETMDKLYSLKQKFKKRNQLFEVLLSKFSFKKINKKNTFYSEDFENYIKENRIKLSKTLKHKDYECNSATIKTSLYEKIKNIAKYYRISRSSLIRVMIDSYET